jgi:hypothetical protein
MGRRVTTFQPAPERRDSTLPSVLFRREMRAGDDVAGTKKAADPEGTAAQVSAGVPKK